MKGKQCNGVIKLFKTGFNPELKRKLLIILSNLKAKNLHKRILMRSRERISLQKKNEKKRDSSVYSTEQPPASNLMEQMTILKKNLKSWQTYYKFSCFQKGKLGTMVDPEFFSDHFSLEFNFLSTLWISTAFYRLFLDIFFWLFLQIPLGLNH